MTRWSILTLTFLSLVCNAFAVTLYVPEGQETLFGKTPTSTDTNLAATYTGSAAYDPRTLIPPAPPTDPPVNTQFGVQLVGGDIPGLSIRHHGAFLGFSVELSVSNHVCECLDIRFGVLPTNFGYGRQIVQWVLMGMLPVFAACLTINVVFRRSTLAVPFLNLIANLQERAGKVHIRVGGNSQETAVLVPSIPGGITLEKDHSRVYNPVSSQRDPLYSLYAEIYFQRHKRRR